MYHCTPLYSNTKVISVPSLSPAITHCLLIDESECIILYTLIHIAIHFHLVVYSALLHPYSVHSCSIDIHIAEVVGIGDSLHNISLVKEFCDGYLPTGIFHFTYEDILYSSDTIKPSLLTFITQLFYYFVVHPLDIVSPCDLQTNIHSSQGICNIRYMLCYCSCWLCSWIRLILGQLGILAILIGRYNSCLSFGVI